MSKIEGKYRGTKEYALVYAELITAARYRGTITYQEIAQLVGMPLEGHLMGKKMGQLLGEISEDEVSRNRPMLSAIAINTVGTLGLGFFTLARNLKRLHSEEHNDERQFLEKEQKAVYDTWKVELRENK